MPAESMRHVSPTRRTFLSSDSLRRSTEFALLCIAPAPNQAEPRTCFLKNPPTSGLFPLLLARGVARIARRLALGFQRHFASGRFFLFAGELGRSLGGEPFFLGLLRRL